MNVVLTFVIAIFIALHFGNPIITTRVIGQVRPLPNAPAFAQLQPGDTILAVNDLPVRNWEDAVRGIAASKDSVVFRTSRATVRQPLGGNGPSAEQILSSLDFERPAVLDAILPGGRADQAGLQSGDSIVAIDGRPVSTWGQLVSVVSAAPERALRISLVRQQRTLDVTVTPKATPDTLAAAQIRTVGKIGASSRIPTAREQMPFGTAVAAGSRMTLFMAGAIVDIVKKLVTREISVSQLSGPVGITRMSVEAARSGLESLLTLIALLSVNVAILNMLPIPILDGGQIVINVLESAKGKPFSLRTREYILRFGLLAIALLFVVVMYNDTHGWFARIASWLGRLRG
jgi:regulator of sigma E protease